MRVNLKGRSFLKLLDFSPAEINYLIMLAEDFKRLKRAGILHKRLEGKNIALLFEKTSTRTRCAFEVAAMDLGMGVTYIESSSSHMGKKESIEDTARVLGRFYDGIEFRGYSQEAVEELAEKSGVSVWNGLTDKFHPTQVLADLLTIKENFGYWKGIKFTYFGDARNNMGNSYLVACAKLGMHFVACGPIDLMPDPELVELCRKIAEKTGGSISFTQDIEEGAKDAEVIATDIWVSMGESDAIWADRIDLLKPYQVNKSVMQRAKSTAIFMHCLPSFHDTETMIGKEISEKFGINAMEVSDEVFESDQSKVFDEAENRMHTIKAVMFATLY